MSALLDNVARSVRALAEPDPYRTNPFRVLGLSPLANARETSRRSEGLRVAAELGEAPAGWAFAPSDGLKPEAVRAAAETLHDPLTRFVCEFFWFWPLTYPAAAPDPAMIALAEGDTDSATRLWAAPPPDGAVAALHNLAVYQHVLALEWENDPAADPAQLAELRASVVAYWRGTLAKPGLPALLAARLHAFTDPSLPADLPRVLLALVPEVLARAQLRLALLRAETDRFAESEEQLRLARLFLPSHEALAPLVAEIAGPLESRFHSGIRTLIASDTTPLDLASALIRSGAPDLLRLQTLLGRAAPAAHAATGALVLAVLDAVTAHQTSGGAAQDTLPHLLYLVDQPASPELAQRLAAAFQATSAKALASVRAAASAPEPDRHALDRDATLRLILERLTPAGAGALGLPAPALASYRARLARWIVDLANEAVATGRPEAEDWARAQLGLALEDNPAGTPAHEEISAALARLALAESLAFSISGPANTFSIDRTGIALDGKLIAPADLTALRLGADHSSAGAGRTLLAWSSSSQADALYLDQLEGPENADPELERRVREAVEYFLIPPLVSRVETALHSGKRVVVGPLTITQAGIHLDTHRLIGSKTQLIPFAEAKVHTTTDGCLLVADPAHPRLHPPLDPAVTWNAILIPRLITHFARSAHGRFA